MFCLTFRVIAKARVPIVKFVEKRSGVAFDIRFNQNLSFSLYSTNFLLKHSWVCLHLGYPFTSPIFLFIYLFIFLLLLLLLFFVFTIYFFCLNIFVCTELIGYIKSLKGSVWVFQVSTNTILVISWMPCSLERSLGSRLGRFLSFSLGTF